MVAAFLLVLGTAGFAASPVDPVNRDRQGVALHGHDPVAYFQQQKPVQGSPQFTYQWMDATWRFATADHRDLFSADPLRYAPQFGGYCSWAVSQGYTADIDPQAWKIIDGRLYLNYSKSVQRMWEKDVAKRIEDAAGNWPKLHK